MKAGREPYHGSLPATAVSIIVILLLVGVAQVMAAGIDLPATAPLAPLSAPTTVALTPADATVCDQATVTIAINNVANLYGYQFRVTYDPAIVSAVAAFDNTWFDPAVNGFDGPANWAAACDNTLGECRLARTRGYPDGPLSGSGAVAHIDFTSHHPATTTSVDVDVVDVILSDIDGYKVLPVEGGSATLSVCGEEPAGLCPTENPNVGNLRTDLIGTGQTGRTRKVVIPNHTQVQELYGQLAGSEFGIMHFVRFRYPNNTYVQVDAPTSPGYRQHAVRWWGSELVAARHISGQFYWGKRGNKSPMAFVLWPRYATSEPYADVFELFDESIANHVYWATNKGWIDEVTQVLELPPTLADGADVIVKVALAGNDKDKRPIVLTVTARAGGVDGVSRELVILGPNSKKVLNRETILLESVAAGTNEIVLTLFSPGPHDPVYNTGPLGGDSVGMIGAAASYACALP